MGCDIHSFVEVRKDGQWSTAGKIFPLDGEHGSAPFACRNYGWFGFLADVRNYSCVPSIQKHQHALPPDCSDEVRESGENSDGHTYGWLTLRQLIDYDYDQIVWDRRITKQLGPNLWTGAGRAEEGEGERLPLRQFLGEKFFWYVDIMKTLGDPDDVRVVFWFDN